MPILFLFLICIIIVIPAFVWFWFANSNKYDESGMIVEDQRIFFEFLNENILLRQMPFVLGVALEFSSMKIRQQEAEELNKLWKEYKDQMPKHKEETIPFSNRKAVCLIYAYINNRQLITPGLDEETNKILKSAPVLLNNMYSMAVYFTNFKLINKNFHKNFGYNCIKTILEFSQILHQRLPFGKDGSPFLQLPGFTEAKYKEVKKPKAGQELKLTSLPAFLQLTSDQKRVLLKDEFKEDEIKNIEKCCEMLPQYKFKVETFVEGFEEILIDDLLTIKVTIERSNLEENKELGVLHSNDFPELFNEKVAVILKIGDNRIVYESVLDIEGKITTHEYKHMVREVGLFKFEAELIPLNYKGMDMSFPFEIQVKSDSLERVKFIKEIEKREVKKLEPSLFQQMLQQVFPLQDQDEEEEEEEEGAEKTNDENNEESGDNTEGNNINSPSNPDRLMEEPEEDSRGRRKKKQI